MNYKEHYEKLITRSNYRDITGYTEIHHIVPKCLGGTDELTNLVKLTAREHFIAHALLAKMYIKTNDAYKLISAFRFMSVDSHSGNRHNNRDYEWMRKMFSKNHPSKLEHVKEKISNSLKLFYKNNPGFKLKIPNILVFCECGCGESFNKKETSTKRFIYGHHVIQTEDRKLKTSKSIKTNLSKLSTTDMQLRMANSVLKCDQEERGKAISTGKKGKPTNQKELEIEKYSSMTEEYFNSFIQGRAKNIISRMTIRRNEGIKRKL